MSKSLVAYFSASGVTKMLAEKLAGEIKADLFEIQAERAYTNADLDWQNSKSRSSIEMNDPSCRPAIRSKIADMSQYDVIFVGFPIWWYREPSIVDTFMEAYDFSGKTIIPLQHPAAATWAIPIKIWRLLHPKPRWQRANALRDRFPAKSFRTGQQIGCDFHGLRSKCADLLNNYDSSIRIPCDSYQRYTSKNSRVHPVNSIYSFPDSFPAVSSRALNPLYPQYPFSSLFHRFFLLSDLHFL